MKTIQLFMITWYVIGCLVWSLISIAAQYDPIVEKAQQQLTALGYSVGTVDGKMGQKTMEAINKFQDAQGLAL